MGACFSCLGLNYNRDTPDDDENSRLLYDDAHVNQYGSFGDQNPGIMQADPQEVQRETEALQKVVAQTSNHLVDIFAMVPQNITRASTMVFSAHDARLLRYQDVLAKMSAHDQSNQTNRLSSDSLRDISDGWISEQDEVEELKSHKVAKPGDIGPLLVGFADAESAME